jgi:hypothetical protein
MYNKVALGRRALLRGSAAATASAAIALAGDRQPAFADPGAALVSVEWPATVQNVQGLRYTATDTTYDSTSTDPAQYVHCEVVFVVPPSGRVMVHWSGALRNLSGSESPVTYLSPEVRSGATFDSGAMVLASADARTVRCNLADAQTIRAGASHLLSGLTPGATYSARMQHRVTSSTGEFFYHGLIVAPTS